ncbi:MAG TPA: hypothetical protein VFG19_06535 [Geobacteraceae bacterium]|nr:hypothetical protein [Geobacteraceae bacterium]
MQNNQYYAFPKKLKIIMHLCGWGFIAFGIGETGILWFDPPKGPAGVVFFLCAGLAFFVAGWYTFRNLSGLDAWIETTDTGLACCRPDGSRKTVNWHDVGNLRERPLLQRLEFTANNDSSVVRVDYQIERFSELRAFIVSHINDDVPLQFPITYGKPPWYFLVNIVGIVLPIGGLAYLRNQNCFLSIGLLFIVYMIAWDFILTPAAITIMHDSIRVRYPFRAKTFYVFQIENIRMEDQFVKGNRHPYVLLEITGEKPLKLKSLGCGTLQLFRNLSRFKADSLP